MKMQILYDYLPFRLNSIAKGIHEKKKSIVTYCWYWLWEIPIPSWNVCEGIYLFSAIPVFIIFFFLEVGFSNYTGMKNGKCVLEYVSTDEICHKYYTNLRRFCDFSTSVIFQMTKPSKRIILKKYIYWNI